MSVQRIEALEVRDGNQEVAADIAHHPLHLTLVVALAGTAEPVLEQVVGLELGEGSGALAPAVPQYPGHRQLRVVVQDALGHPTQEGESGDVAVQESLGGLRRIGFDEAAVAVGQVQDEVVGFALHPADDHQGFAKVALGVPRGMGQRHEHLLRPPPMFPHVVLHDGVLAGEPVLVPQALKDALGGVALLPGNPEVVFQYPVDDAGKGLLLSLSKGWDGGAGSAAGSPVGLSRRSSCAPCPGATRTPGRPLGCSCLRPLRPGAPADTLPLGTSVAPSIGSTSNLWMAADGPFFNRQLSAGQSARMVHFNSAFYNLWRDLPYPRTAGSP